MNTQSEKIYITKKQLVSIDKTILALKQQIYHLEKLLRNKKW